MTLYYTHKFKESKVTSHELLELAISDYIDNKKEAAALVQALKKDSSKIYEGRPYIEGFEEFSISHSGNSWAVLIDRRICGLDIQYERGCDYINIARRFFHPTDAAMLDTAEDFFTIWTKREALVKALGLSVATDDLPPVHLNSGAEYEGRYYYVGSIDMPDADRLHAAICLDASEDINERLIYKEIYVKE